MARTKRSLLKERKTIKVHLAYYPFSSMFHLFFHVCDTILYIYFCVPLDHTYVELCNKQNKIFASTTKKEYIYVSLYIQLVFFSFSFFFSCFIKMIWDLIKNKIKDDKKKKKKIIFAKDFSQHEHLLVDFNCEFSLTILVWPIRIGVRTAATPAADASEWRRRLGVRMVRLWSRGGADTSALGLRERTTVSANFRFAVAHVAEAWLIESFLYAHRFVSIVYESDNCPFGTL